MSSFQTDQIFSSREDVEEWVRNVGRTLGYVVVTRRTKTKNGYLSRIIFMCDRGGVFKGKETSSRNTGTRKIDCPFELHACYYKLNDIWMLKVKNDQHNHDPAMFLEGHPYARRLTPKESEMVAEMRRNNVPPWKILEVLKIQNEDNVSTIKTIYNEGNKVDRLDARQINEDNCGCQLRSSCGLPCAHELAMYLDVNQNIPLESIDNFWKKLDLESVVVTNEDASFGLDAGVGLFKESYAKQPAEHKRSYMKKLWGIFSPSTNTVDDPAVHTKTRGRPRLSKQKSKNVAHNTTPIPTYTPLPTYTPTNSQPPPTEYPRRQSVSSYTTYNMDTNLFDSSQIPERHSTHSFREPLISNTTPLPTHRSYQHLSNQLSNVFHPYIRHIQDVRADGNCGFRAISASVGDHEDNWPTVRRNLIQELMNYREEYENIFGVGECNAIYNALNFFWTDRVAPEEYWLSTDMGVLIASVYNVIFVILSSGGGTTYFPLRSSPPPLHQHTHIAIGHVNGAHWVKVTLNEGYPMPQIHPHWTYFKYDIAAAWATLYEMQLQMYINYFRSIRNSVRIVVDD